MRRFHDGIWHTPKTLNLLQKKKKKVSLLPQLNSGNRQVRSFVQVGQTFFYSPPFLKCCFPSPLNNVAAFHRVLSEQLWKVAFNPKRSQDSKVCCGYMGEMQS